ncbi:hypothetical protein [Zavarzinella formosa]|uniref:hypothetical protein n=1 Tax=Zavarzinella formosa TaxID=360055 RepID=UPI0002DE136A|nr:hypothetical protein [Zavarzinella formosa]
MRFNFLILLWLTSSLTAAPAPDNKATEEALRQAADALAKVKGDSRARVGLWCEVTILRYKLGDRRGSQAALREALTSVDKNEAAEEWRMIGSALGRLGEAEATLDLADAIPDKTDDSPDNPRQIVLQEAASQTAGARQFEAARKIADTIPDESARTQTRQAVSRLEAVSKLRKADSEEAIRPIWDSLTASQKVSMLVGRPLALVGIDDTAPPEDGIAIALLNAKDKAEAKRVSLKALALLSDVEANRRAALAVAVVRMLCRLDEVAEARKVLPLIPPADPKIPEKGVTNETRAMYARAYIAAAEVRAGRDEAATALLKDCKRKGDEALLLQFIALAQARAGRKDASKAGFAKALEYHEADPAGLCLSPQLACAQALSGDIDGAIRTAAKLKCNSITWGEIISRQTAAGDFNGARQTANDHLDRGSNPSRPSVLRTIAARQAKAGQGEEVRAWAGKLENNLERANAFLGLAEGLWREPAQPGGK